jgi:hypothetical protein
MAATTYDDPYGDIYTNQLAGRVAINDPGQGINKGFLAGDGVATSDPFGTATNGTQSAPAVSKSGNPASDWQSFVSGKNYSGTYARTNMPQLVNEFNQLYGYNIQAGRPNASGLTDVINVNGKDIDVVHGGDDAWQWLDTTTNSGGGTPGSNGATYNYTPRAPYVPPTRTPLPDGSILDASNSTNTNRNALYDRLMGVATGSIAEKSNPNFTIDPNDPIIKGQTDAFSAQNQLAQRNYLAQVAEKAGSNANISAETRAAAETGGQATSAFQAKLMSDELGARRQEVQQALQLAVQQNDTESQLRLTEQLARIQQAEQMYQFDATLGQNAYQFDVNDQYRNSPLAG